MLPLSLTSLSQRIDEVRVQEIADYSTYYQPVVMRDIFGFGKPLEEKPMLWEPGILTMAWGSVVRQIAAGLGITLDEPLTEKVDRRPAERDVETVSVDIPAGHDGRGPVRGDRQASTACPGSCSSTSPAPPRTRCPSGRRRRRAAAATGSSSPASR